MLDLKSVDMRFMYLTELREKDIYVGDKKCKRVKIYVGRPLRDTPKTYKQISGFGDSIVNNLLSLGAEPTNVVRQDGLIEWKSDGYIEVGGVQVWAYYYFEDGEDVDRCDWEDHMEIEVEECWI